MTSSMKLLGMGILAMLIGIAMAVPVAANPLVGTVGTTLSPVSDYGSGGTGAPVLNVKFRHGFQGGSGYWSGNYWGYPYSGGSYYYSPYGYSTIDPWYNKGGTRVCTFNGYGYTCYGPDRSFY
ncbi:MAG: hypothetical protein HY914_22375 [Desulfomonile tiedjei]|nr:hypothetical protein [Desulfomonile tiedjei]